MCIAERYFFNIKLLHEEFCHYINPFQWHTQFHKQLPFIYAYCISLRRYLWCHQGPGGTTTLSWHCQEPPSTQWGLATGVGPACTLIWSPVSAQPRAVSPCLRFIIIWWLLDCQQDPPALSAVLGCCRRQGPHKPLACNPSPSCVQHCLARAQGTRSPGPEKNIRNIV